MTDEFEIKLFKLINEARSTYGLRQQTYVKYKKHCVGKIYKLRVALEINNHANSKDESYSDTIHLIEKNPELLKSDARYIELLIYEAERAWCLGMEIKTDQTKSERKKFQIKSRLSKAGKFTKCLEKACELGVLDQQTILEIKAYSWSMLGLHAVESKCWKSALEYLSASSELLEKLATSEKISSTDKALFHRFCDEIEPSLRFCSYNLDRMDESMEEPQIESVNLLESISSLLKIFASDSEDLSSNSVSIEWFGNSIEVRSSELSRLYIQSSEAEKIVFSKQAIDEKTQMSQFDLIVGAYADIVQVGAKLAEETRVANEKILSSKSAELNSQLRLFQACAEQRFHTSMILRNWILCNSHYSLNEGTTIPQIKFLGRVEEVAQLTQKMLQALEAISKIAMFEEEYGLEQWVISQVSFFKAFRMIFIGQEFLNKRKLSESLSLFEKAHELFSQAHVAKKQASQSDFILDMVISPKEHETWESVSLALTQQTHALWAVENSKNSADIVSSISALGINNRIEPLSVLDSLNRIPQFKLLDCDVANSSPIQPPLFSFKPTLLPIPFKPIVFDIASKEFSESGSIGQDFETRFRKCAGVEQISEQATQSSTGVLGNLFSFFGK